MLLMLDYRCIRASPPSPARAAMTSDKVPDGKENSRDLEVEEWRRIMSKVVQKQVSKKILGWDRSKRHLDKGLGLATYSVDDCSKDICDRMDDRAEEPAYGTDDISPRK